MRKIMLLLVVSMLSGIMLNAQSKKGNIDVLYFKANLPCCKARACNALEADLQKIIQKNYTDGTVVLKQIKLDDEANKSLIDKYKAKSQTVIIVKTLKKKEFSEDISDLVSAYFFNKNLENFEKELIVKIDELKKK
ncbi:MAG: hypothetical protein KA792_02690 [Bacteroidales bacterium]|nr:hypothetical protein [Bacteroidales bacterium]